MQEILDPDKARDKAALRRHFRDARAEFVKREGTKAATTLTHNLQRLIGDLGIAQVAIYSPLKDEASFHLQSEESYFFPRLTGDDMAFWRPTTELQTGALGIAEPEPETSTPLNTTQPMLICCPAVAVDWQGHRMGMGRGYYDRFFANHPGAVRVGVAFQIQVSKDPLPVDSWDQPLDWIVTEEMILRTSNRSP